jgi:ketosteroid isomerase-like protein
MSICILLTATLCGFAGYTPPQTEPESAIKSKIAAFEQSWYDALKIRDTKAIDAILDSRVLLVNDDGSVQTKGDFLASMKQSFALPAAQQEQVLSYSLNVKVFGTTAVAIGEMWIKGVERGRPYLRHERFLDTWKYGNGSWTIVGTEATPVLH